MLIISSPKVAVRDFVLEIPREKAPELYKFARFYVYPRTVVTLDEYVRLFKHAFPVDLVDLLTDLRECEEIFGERFGEEFCPVDPYKVGEEFWRVLEEDPRFREMVEDSGASLFDIEPEDDKIVVDRMIKIEPYISFEGDDYRIKLLVERTRSRRYSRRGGL